jgi:hypothetical protein
LPTLFQGRRSTTPHGLGSACVRASSIAMVSHLWCKLLKSRVLWYRWCGAPNHRSGVGVA